ncbi:Piso0_000610 [Millerozyma farinosa CBS 7064]|uniref:Piso0_000610 protein n=1 Tax=Pichia sorbitophila (strain ATCC MYA-4447 / BCRC 22081 / CBS 7064 / NBRC 10061 / NRRL Y-12695) TaxID=559304 RepID=G8YR10_PICSO|nr:Piso0_000610 [Millerozyma farinosa CBS 7064]
MTSNSIESVAVIGGGPSGLAALHALKSEHSFGKIRLFERKSEPGGLWVHDDIPEELPLLTSEKISKPLAVPGNLPGKYPTQGFPVGFKSPAYKYMESNVPEPLMSFSYAHIKEVCSPKSVELLGPNHPFRHIDVVKQFIQDEFKKYIGMVQYNTSVERVFKRGDNWILILREINKDNDGHDYWYEESFDAILVANGHYSVPNLPNVPGTQELQKANKSMVQHISSFRNVEDYRDMKVLIVGTGISSTDFVSDILPVVQKPLYVSVRGEVPRKDFLDSFDGNSSLSLKPGVKSVHLSRDREHFNATFTDNSTLEGLDKLVFATGYIFDFPFLSDEEIVVNENNRIENLYQHIFKIGDPTLSFIGAVIAGISFRVFEYQATLVARVLSKRTSLPSVEEQIKWEKDLLEKRGDLHTFHVVPPDFKVYYDDIVRLAGPANGKGHELEPFGDDWITILNNGRNLKLKYWRRN